MKKVLGMLCVCLLLINSAATGIPVQAGNCAAGSEKKEAETGNLFSYQGMEGSRCVSVVKADTEADWKRENVPEDEINETSRMIYNGPVSVRVELPGEKVSDGETDDENDMEDREDDKDTADIEQADKNKENVDKHRNYYENFIVSIWHNETEIWRAPVEKEETIDFICQISGWKWQKEAQSYELQVFCFAEGDYQIRIEEMLDAGEENQKDAKMEESDSEGVKSEESDSKEVKLTGKSAMVTVDRTPPEAYLSWRRKEAASEGGQTNGTQLVELSVRDKTFRPSEVEWKVFTKKNETGKTKQENYWTDTATRSLKKWDDWTRDKQDKDLWHATVPLQADGIYQMELKYTDLAGHGLQQTCMGTLVIDTDSPLLNVVYPAPIQKQNGKSYYAKKLDVVLMVTETNFSQEDFGLSVTKDGITEAVQAEWDAIGTTQYRTVLTLEEDGEYEIQAFYTDPYGNEMEPYQSEKIVLDQAVPEIKVSEIRADTAEKNTITNAVLQILDAEGNLDPESVQPMLKRVVTGENGTYLTEEVLLPLPVKEKNTGSWNYRIPELTEDGIYMLTCQAEDYAGNCTNEIKTQDGIAHRMIKFSINRCGSTFEVDDDVMELTDRYYIYQVESDVEIREVNTDRIENYSVRLNGTVLQEGKDYFTDAVNGENTWSMRRYIVKKGVFAKEGEYHLVVESQDKTGTKAYSDMKKVQLSWVVDQSAPSVLLMGLEANHVYEAEKQQVTAVPSDAGGKLKSFQVSVGDALGIDRQVLVNLTGEKLEQYLKNNEGQIHFSIPEGVDQQVEIVCEDQAWKKEGGTNAYHEVINGVSVAKNQKSLRRMKRDLEKKLREGAEHSETGGEPEIQKRNPAAAIAVLVMAAGFVCFVTVGARKRKKNRKEKMDT